MGKRSPWQPDMPPRASSQQRGGRAAEGGRACGLGKEDCGLAGPDLRVCTKQGRIETSGSGSGRGCYQARLERDQVL